MNKKYFKDKVVWITGASSGIGEELTYLINSLGAKVIISARRKNELEKVKNNCDFRSNVKILELDLEKIDELEYKTQQAIDIFGKVDILINNAGIGQRSLVKETNIEIDKKIMNINYIGTVALTKYVLPNMIKNHNGHIVVVSSLVGYFGTPYRSAYSASKHAIQGFFDSMRAELSKDNIKVTIICPGFIETEITVKALTSTGGEYGQRPVFPKGFGLTSKECAKKSVDVISKQKNEALIGGTEIVSVYLKKYFPLIFSKMIERIRVI
jgi:dehydrogenase/reductase SDR family protein 7B